jgi:NAD(P)-dependent dehydrogenase (short-subunit alcohol dehydrogenase family)
VVVADIDESGAASVVSEVEALGRRGLAAACDVALREQVERLVDESIAWQGHLDVFMSNAGVGVGGPPHKVPLEDWEWIVDVNLWSHIWAVRRVLPHMLERGTGHLVHTASSAGTIGFPSLVPYCVTKFAVVGLCESLAVWCHDKGVGVSVVCPLAVATNITEGSRMTPEGDEGAELQDRFKAFGRQILHQMGIPPEQVADDVVSAVREGHLYVLPHPELKAMVGDKWRDPDAWVGNAAAAWQMQRQMAEQMLGAEQGASPA